MKLNLGCGYKKSPNYINVDKFEACKPDILADLEVTPWPFRTNEIDEVLFNHSLEHMGADVSVFLNIMKELYRVCKAGAKVQVNVPHPRHDDFINDPTHVRIITPELFRLFSKKLNQYWVDTGDARTPFALYLDVDFELKVCTLISDQRYQALQQAGKITPQDLINLMRERNNVIKSYELQLEVIK